MIAVSSEINPLFAALVLQIHDELLFEVDASRVVAAARAVCAIVERAGDTNELKVPLRMRSR